MENSISKKEIMGRDVPKHPKFLTLFSLSLPGLSLDTLLL